MPVYEYQCKACGHEFEREQRISDPPVKKCPSCGAAKARRLISRTSFVLKGGGWYSDLYATKPAAEAYAAKADAKPEAEKAAAAAPSEAKQAETKSDGGSQGDSPGPSSGPKKGGKGGKGKGAKAAA